MKRIKHAISRRALVLAGSACLVAGLLTGGAMAQSSYPDRTITLIVPVAAGGNGDLAARVVAEGLTVELGQSVVVENITGAGGLTGASQVAQAAPDGYTLMLDYNALVTNAALNANSTVDSMRDFAQVSQITSSYIILIVPADSPFETVEDLIAYAKEHPGELSFASSGIASGSHLGSELIKSLGGVDMVHIPYEGGPQATTDLIAGRVDLFWLNPATVLPLIESGEVRALATAAPEKQEITGDIPSIRDTLPDFDLNNWLSIAVPKATPPEVVEQLNTAVNAVLDNPTYAQRLTDLGLGVQGGSAADMDALVQSDIERWTALAQEAGIVIN